MDYFRNGNIFGKINYKKCGMEKLRKDKRGGF